MAKKNKGRTKRTDNDFYPTPQPLVDAICQRLFHVVDPASFQFIVEPSAGSGNFIQAIRRFWPNYPVYAIDIRMEAGPDCMAKGATQFTVGDWPNIAFNWKPQAKGFVVGNPPFSQAEAHIKAVMDFMLPGTTLAFLLKLNFLGGKEREHVLWRLGQLKHLIPIVGRPSFKKTELASTDNNEYGLFIWEVGFTGLPTVLFPHIEWK
jgi:hypothetical protein